MLKLKLKLRAREKELKSGKHLKIDKEDLTCRQQESLNKKTKQEYATNIKNYNKTFLKKKDMKHMEKHTTYQRTLTWNKHHKDMFK